MSRPVKRICLLIHGSFGAAYGGGQIYARNLAYGLVRARFDVTVLECMQDVPLGSGCVVRIAPSDANGIRRVRVHLPADATPEQSETVLLDAMAAAKPDVVHAHGWKALAARACARSGIPCVITAHHGGLVCPAGALLDYSDAICRRPVEQRQCTYCCSRQQPLGWFWCRVLTCLPTALQFKLGRLLQRLPLIPYLTPALTIPLQVQQKRLAVDELIASARCIIAPSNAMQAALLRNGCPPQRTMVIPHGIPALEPADPLAAANSGITRFAYVGRLTRIKGLHVLLQALDRLEGAVELHVVGKADANWERRYWTACVKRVRCRERLIQHGQLFGTDCQAVVARCDVVVLPSICLEVFGLAIAEAFAAGRPVITTESGGPAEQVRNGLDGVIIPPNDVQALAAAMQSFVDDPARASVLAKNIRAPMTIADHVEALGSVYLECAKRNEAHA